MKIEIPLFPLNTVLFPGMPLQLHIFEERYKKMIHYCTENKSFFGVALIKQGIEAYGPIPEPYSIGCLAKITEVEALSQGRYNIMTVGHERFEILQLKHGLPYLVGVVQESPLPVGDPIGAALQVKNLQPLIERYLRALGEGEDIEKVIKNMPSEPRLFAYLGAVLLQIPSPQKQPFLECKDSQELMNKLETSLRREVAFVESTSVKQPTKMQGSFSVN